MSVRNIKWKDPVYFYAWYFPMSDFLMVVIVGKITANICLSVLELTKYIKVLNRQVNIADDVSCSFVFLFVKKAAVCLGRKG